MKTTQTEKKRDGGATPQWTSDFPIPQKRGNNDSNPALLFDKAPSNSNPTIELLTASEAAEFLRISKAGVRRLQYGRHVPFYKVGGSVRFAKSDLMSYLEKTRVEALG